MYGRKIEQSGVDPGGGVASNGVARDVWQVAAMRLAGVAQEMRTSGYDCST